MVVGDDVTDGIDNADNDVIRLFALGGGLFPGELKYTLLGDRNKFLTNNP